MTTNHRTFVAIRTFLASYIAFPKPVYADICALWAIGTHVYDRFDAFGYLVITASTKRAGKSILADLLAMASRDAKNGTSMTASVMRRLVSKGATLFFDEAESLNSESASAVREYLNIGYRAGQSVFMPGNGPDEVIEYPAYSPKCFILIGDVNDTLRDRSIPIELMRAKAPKPYKRSEAEATAREIQQGLTEAIAHVMEHAEDVDAYDYLEGRDAEVWSAILTLAHAFAPETFDDIVRCAVDLSALKATTEKRRFSEIRREAEKKAGDDAFGERAMRDLASVLTANDKQGLHSETAIERMKSIATAPWRTYKGTGLTPVLLSDLIDVYGAKTKSIKIGKVVKRGYTRESIAAGMRKLAHRPSEV